MKNAYHCSLEISSANTLSSERLENTFKERLSLICWSRDAMAAGSIGEGDKIWSFDT